MQAQQKMNYTSSSNLCKSTWGKFSLINVSPPPPTPSNVVIVLIKRGKSYDVYSEQLFTHEMLS